MDNAAVKRYVLASAVNAEVAGMVAENISREQNGESIAYVEGHFQEKAEELHNLANCHDDNL